MTLLFGKIFTEMRHEGDRRLGDVLEAGELRERDDQVPDDVGHPIVRRHRRKATKARKTFFDQRVLNRGPKFERVQYFRS